MDRTAQRRSERMSFRRKITRRQFIKGAAIAGGAMMMPGLGPFVRNAHAYATSIRLQKFVWRMPMFGGSRPGIDVPEIPLAATAGAPYGADVDYYQLTAGTFRQQLHPGLPNPTRLYGYADHSGSYVHLGGAIVAQQGRPVRFSFNSALPVAHILPYDITIPNGGNGGDRQDRAAVHLHGGLVPWTSDGGPFHWQSNPANPGGIQYGASVEPWLWDGATNLDGSPNTGSKVWDYYYPNNQSARLMWYHDHAIGQTRLNAYAGVASGYVLTDLVEEGLGLPFGDPIVFQDKVFWDPANDPAYANFVPGVLPGDLWYPHFYDPAIWPIAKGGVPPTPSAIPEFFGDTMLANGIPYPFHDVGIGKYRFRFLNACNARFLDLSFVQERFHPKNGWTGEPVLTNTGLPVAANVDVWQIGTEGGFLRSPVPLVLAGVPVQPFVLGPAERADIIVDFKAAGNVILYNVAGSPFPGGAPIFDWFAGSNKTPVGTKPGFGPNTRTIMRFAVNGASTNVFTIPAVIEGVSWIPTAIDPVNGGLRVDPTSINAAGFYTDPVTGHQFEYDPIPVELTLNEVVEPQGFANGGANTGRLLTLIGNRAATGALPFGAGGIYYEEPPTESVRYNTLRIWKVYNLTADAHPMHFHLFNVQILGRQVVDKNLLPRGPAVFPLPNEMGFKETVTMYPGEVTTVAALVEDPLPGRNVAVTSGGKTVNCPLPYSSRFPGKNWDEYVWHCHILEHEEHDMMRPLVASGP
jgi:spore coat protein A, manganese oxidase